MIIKKHKPYCMLINKIKRRFFLDKNEKHFIHFVKNFCKVISNKAILIEAPLDDNFFLIKNFLIGKYLSYKYNCKLVYYINFNRIRSFSSFYKFFYYKLVYNFFSFLKTKKLYNSFCDKILLNCYYPNNNFYFNFKKFFKNKNLFNKIVNFSYRNVFIGDIIIDSYLYYFYNFLYPFKIENCVYEQNFKSHFIESLKLAESFFHLYKNNDIKYLINNYSGYLDHGLAAKFAEKNNVPIFYISEVDRPFIKSRLSKHKKDYDNFKKIFVKLTNKNNKIKHCSNILKKRFSGKIDYPVSYLKNSYYKDTNIKIANNSKKSICIFTHNTMDSLFGFGSMLFFHQKSWIEFTLDSLTNFHKKFNIFFKIHPNETVGGEIYLRNVVNKYKFVKILHKSTNNNSIINSNLILGLTLHGTIGLELAYHKIPTIFANKNPYIAFDFCKNPQSINEYKLMLSNLESFKKKEKYKEESAIFYYMNNIFPGFGKISERRDDILGLMKFNKLNNNFTSEQLGKYLSYINKSKIYKIFDKLKKSEETFDNFKIPTM